MTVQILRASFFQILQESSNETFLLIFTHYEINTDYIALLMAFFNSTERKKTLLNFCFDDDKKQCMKICFFVAGLFCETFFAGFYY